MDTIQPEPTTDRPRHARPDLPAPASLPRRLSRAALDALREESADHPGGRPQTRGECLDGPRPCPWVSCRHHLYLEVNDRTVKLNFPSLEPDEMEESCSLDVADRGGVLQEEVGALLNLTRERAKQIENAALVSLPQDHLRELYDGTQPERRRLPLLPPPVEAPPLAAPLPIRPPGRQRSRGQEAILSLLASGPRLWPDLARAAGASDPSVARMLRRLIRAGEVTKIRAGMYALRSAEAAE